MKTAAYICKGCGIGERVNTAQMATIATKEGKMNLVREHDFLCNAAGVQMIRDDIEKEGRHSRDDRRLFAPRQDRGIPVPDRGAGARQHPRRRDLEPARYAGSEGNHAGDGRRLRAHGLRRSQENEAARRQPSVGHNKRILVVGGGISGMTAALEAAKTGYDVVLVEKEKQLGGWAAKLHKRVPYREPIRIPPIPASTK